MNNHDAPETPGREGSIPATLAQAARCLEKINRPFPTQAATSIDQLIDDLVLTMQGDNNRNLMLHTQAQLLDALFKRLLAHDAPSEWKRMDGTMVYSLSDDQLNAALRSQRQCRATIASLDRMKNRKEKK